MHIYSTPKKKKLFIHSMLRQSKLTRTTDRTGERTSTKRTKITLYRQWQTVFLHIVFNVKLETKHNKVEYDFSAKKKRKSERWCKEDENVKFEWNNTVKSQYTVFCPITGRMKNRKSHLVYELNCLNLILRTFCEINLGNLKGLLETKWLYTLRKLNYPVYLFDEVIKFI